MAEIASAFVTLAPSMAGFGRLLSRDLDPISRRAGQDFSRDFTRGAAGVGADIGREVEQGTTDSARGSGSKFGKLFGAVAGLGIGAGIASGIGAALENGAATGKLAASLGANEKQAARLGGIAGKLYSDNFGDSFADVTDSLGAVKTAFRGLGGDALERVTGQAIAFADIFDTDVPESINAARAAVTQGLAKNATQALDLLTVAGQKVGKSLVPDIQDAVTEYGSFFTQLGFTGPKAFSLLAAGAGKGAIGIDKTGDAIAEFTKLAVDPAITKAPLEAIGLTYGQVSKAIVQGGDGASKAFGDVVKGLLKVKNPAKQAELAIGLFGTPIEDLNTSQIPGFLKSLTAGEKGFENFDGAAQRASDTLGNNAAGNIESFKRTFTQGFVDLIGGKVIPAATTGIQKLAPAFNAVAGAVRGVAPALGAAFGFLRQYQNVLLPLAAGIGAVVLAFKAYQLTLVAVAAVTRAYAAAQLALNVALSLNPIGLVVLALVGLGTALFAAYKKSETFRNIVNSAGAAIKSALQPVITKVVAKFREWAPTIQKVAGFVVRLYGEYLKFVAAVAGKVIPVIVKFVGFIVNKTIPAVSAAIGVIGKIIGKAIELGGAFVRGQQKVNGAVNKIVGKIGEIFTEIKAIPGKVTGALGDLGGLLVSAGRSIIQGLIDGIGEMIKPLTDKLGAITKLIPKNKGPESKDKKLLIPAGLLIMQGLIKGLDNGQKALKDKLRRISGTIKSAFDGIKSNMSSLASSVGDAFRTDLFSGNVGDFFANGSLGIANIKAVRGALDKLRGFGVSPAFLSQLFSSGNTDLILSLAGSKTTAKQAQGIFDQTNALSRSLGNAVAANEYRDDLERLGDRFERAVEKLGKRGDRQAQRTANAFAAAVNGAATRGRKGQAA